MNSIPLSVLLWAQFAWMSPLSDSIANTDSHKGQNGLKDRTLTVTTMLIEPYVTVRCDNTSVSAKEAHQQVYQGYMVDLLDLLADSVGFNYRLVPVYDGQYGLFKGDGGWNGMIGEILREEADIAAAPMFVTKRRKRVVAFTQSYRDVSASIVMQTNSFASTLKVNSLVGLLRAKPKVVFGTPKNGAIARSLKRSNNSHVKEMFARMMANPEVSFPANHEEGLALVRKDPLYAYVLQDAIAEYWIRREPCDLMIVDEIEVGEYFGIAARKGSRLVPKLNRGLAKLKSSDELDKLYFKWWWQGDQCHDHLGRTLTIRSGSKQLQRYRSGAHRLNLVFHCFLIVVLFAFA